MFSDVGSAAYFLVVSVLGLLAYSHPVAYRKNRLKILFLLMLSVASAAIAEMVGRLGMQTVVYFPETWDWARFNTMMRTGIMAQYILLLASLGVYSAVLTLLPKWGLISREAQKEIREKEAEKKRREVLESYRAS